MAQRTNTTINVPNILTLVRILLTPLFIILLFRNLFTLALLIFAIAGISDALDGFIARYFNQRTVLGSYLDPIADKMLLLSSYFSLAMMRVIPDWLAVIVIARDLIILMGVAVLTIIRRSFEVRPSIVSKCTTALQLSTIFLTLLKPEMAQIETPQTFAIWATASFTIISGLHYIYIGMNQLQDEPSA